MNDLNEQISRQIKSEFAIRGLSFTDVAKQLDCTRSMISQVAKGIQKTPRVRRAIASAMGKDPWAENGN
jgi:transcriptional regulator with XRE-family HTH domain